MSSLFEHSDFYFILNDHFHTRLHDKSINLCRQKRLYANDFGIDIWHEFKPIFVFISVFVFAYVGIPITH